MNDTTDQRADLRERILGLVMNGGGGRSYKELTEAILAEMPDPRLSIGSNYPPEPMAEPEPESDEERLLGIDPENLVRVPPAELPELFRIHYPDLAARAVEMKAMVDKWQADHKTAAGGWVEIRDDDENAAVAEIMNQADDFAAEVDETRKRVKLDVYEAGLKIDGYFTRGLAEPVMEIRGVARTVSGKRVPPGPGTMQFAMTAYEVAKVARETQRRLLAAQAAQRIADQKAEDARTLAAAERQRIADMEAEGVAPEEAQEIAQAETDTAAAEADAAEESSALVGSYTSASTNELARQRTATGTTIGLSGKWTFAVNEPGGMIDLCLAVGAPALMRESFIQRVAAASLIGQAGAKAVLEAAAKVLMPNGAAIPATFVTTDDKNIRAAITARTSPLREAPGLRIYQEQSARRRGG
jgi:hypothetical protein